MARWVAVHPQRLVGITGAVLQEFGAEAERPLVLGVEFSHVGNGHVEMQLLRDRALRPRRPRERGNTLKGDHQPSVRITKHEPVAPIRVRLTWRRRFVSGPVSPTEQLAIELSQCSSIRGVQDYLPDHRETLLCAHPSHLLRQGYERSPTTETGERECELRMCG